MGSSIRYWRKYEREMNYSNIIVVRLLEKLSIFCDFEVIL
jgi:hypothetical protein